MHFRETWINHLGDFAAHKNNVNTSPIGHLILYYDFRRTE